MTAGPQTQQPQQEAASSDTAHRPRVLWADGGTLVRGPIGDLIRKQYDLREVGDAEAAWQAILLDSTIRVVVADTSAAGVRGIDLIGRVRSSKVPRIRDLPVVAIVERAGSAESQRLGALEVNELVIGKPVPADAGEQLLSRLRVLVELAATRDALAESRTELESARTVDPETDLLTLPAFDKQVDKLLSYARRALSDLALICIRVELTMPRNEAWDGEIEQRMKLVGRTLSSSIRLEDLAARSDKTEFCVATPNNGTSDMLRFAARLRKVLENVDAAGPGVEVWTCIGVATLSEELRLGAAGLRKQAQKRAQIAQDTRSRRIILGTTEAKVASGDSGAEAGSMDINLALALIASGRSDEVLPHLARLLQQINPLLRLVRQQVNPATSPPRPEK